MKKMFCIDYMGSIHIFLYNEEESFHIHFIESLEKGRSLQKVYGILKIITKLCFCKIELLLCQLCQKMF